MSWGRMRPTGRFPRPKPVPPPTPTPVVDLDEDDDSEVFIINNPAEIARAAAACNSKKGNSSGSNVINLDDDEDDEEGGGGDRAGPSTAGAGGSPVTATPPGRPSPRNRYGVNYVSDSDQSNLSDSEGSDSDSGSDGSSDCEILPSVAARRQWEKAASRRMMHQDPPQRKDGRRASTSASSAESSTHHDEDFENLFAPEFPLDDNISKYFSNAFNPVGLSGSKYGTGRSSAPNVHESPMDDDYIYKYFSNAFNPVGTSSTSGSNYGAGRSSAPNVHESPMDVDSNGVEAEDRNPAASLDPDMVCNGEAMHSHKGPVPEKAPSNTPHLDFSFVSKNRVFPACSPDWKHNSDIFISTPERMDERTPERTSSEKDRLHDLVDDPEKLGQSAVVRDGPDLRDGLIGAREKHKESDEYKRAQEEEWASRQRQLAIQAEEAKEAKRLRKRKKAEALRLLDMEKRQKQRVEEVRETQRKGEEDIQLKEQCRGAVKLELENIERTCRDVSSILRALGIPVERGEVKGAYKRALFKFHPDRVSRTDIYQQVKAEETFKFISRFKEKLML